MNKAMNYPCNSRFVSFSLRTLLLILAATWSLQAGGQSTMAVVSDAPAAPSESIPLPPEAQTPEAIFAFLDGLGEMEPTGKSDEELVEHQKKTFRTVLAATNKVMTLQMTDAEAVENSFYRLQALQYLQQLGEPGAGEGFKQAITIALADSRPQVNEIGMKFNVELGLGMWSKLNDQQKSGLIDSIGQYVARGSLDEGKLQMVLTIADYLGDIDGAGYAKRLLDATIPLCKNSGNAEMLEIVPMLEGIARRMGLPGNQMLVQGTLLDGTSFDWANYRGKVVLVDFWATWCGPCRAEVPNVLKLYQAYHDKGFDVVGISLDEKPEDAQTYIQQTGIPWATLFSQNENERGWENPLAIYYGITGIPRAILVDQTGRVVSLTARGPNLERQLRRLLGEPLASAEAETAQKVEVAKPVVEE
jgi:thiol-disulfide isomerase/thioredoxin